MNNTVVERLKEAIAELPAEDKVALAAWLNVQTMDEWDKEMSRDFSPGGRGHHVVVKVKDQVGAGEFRPVSVSQPRD